MVHNSGNAAAIGQEWPEGTMRWRWRAAEKQVTLGSRRNGPVTLVTSRKQISTGGSLVLPLSRDDLRDVLGQLKEWTGDINEIRRSMRLDETQHAALTERIQVVAEAYDLRPDVRRRNGLTEVCLRTPDGGALTAGEVTLAARIEDAYRSVTASW